VIMLVGSEDEFRGARAKNIRWGTEINQLIVVCPNGNLNYKPAPEGVGN